MKIRRWQICPYHCLGGTIKKKPPYNSFGHFLHNPETPAYRSLHLSRSESILIVAFAKYSTQRVKICTLVTDQGHKLETCSTVTRTTENTEHSTGFMWCIRISKSYQLSMRMLILAHNCVSMCFPHWFTTNVKATALVASFIPSSLLHFFTVSAIPPCLCDTFPKFGDLISHREPGVFITTTIAPYIYTDVDWYGFYGICSASSWWDQLTHIHLNTGLLRFDTFWKQCLYWQISRKI